MHLRDTETYLLRKIKPSGSCGVAGVRAFRVQGLVLSSSKFNSKIIAVVGAIFGLRFGGMKVPALPSRSHGLAEKLGVEGLAICLGLLWGVWIRNDPRRAFRPDPRIDFRNDPRMAFRYDPRRILRNIPRMAF